MKKADFLKNAPEAGQVIAVRKMWSRGDSLHYDNIIFYRLLSPELYAKAGYYSRYTENDPLVGGMKLPGVIPNGVDGKPPKGKLAVLLAVERMSYIGPRAEDEDFSLDGSETRSDFEPRRGAFGHGATLPLSEIRDFALVGEHQSLVESLQADKGEDRERAHQKSLDRQAENERQQAASEVLKGLGVPPYGRHLKPTEVLEIAEKYHQARLKSTD